MERVDGLLQLRADVVLVVDPADRPSQVPRQGEDLLMSEEMDPPGSDRRRECVFLFPAHGGMLDELRPLPHDRRHEGVVEEDLAGVEREPVRLLLPGRRLPDPDRVDCRETVRGDPRHDVRDPRVGAHRDDPGDAAVPPRRVEGELAEHAPFLPDRGGAVPRRVHIGGADVETGLHDPQVVLRQGGVHHDVRIAEEAAQRLRVRDIGLDCLDRGRLAEGLQGARTVAPFVRDHDLVDAGVRRELEGDDPPEPSGPKDRRLHGESKRPTGLRSFDLNFRRRSPWPAVRSARPPARRASREFAEVPRTR